MNSGVVKIAEKLGCDHDAAREFCVEVQSYFPNRKPSFVAIAMAVKAVDGNLVDPKDVAQEIQKFPFKYNKPIIRAAKKRNNSSTARNQDRVLPSGLRIRRGPKSMGWDEMPYASFTVD